MKNKIELLSPAGNMESLKAAVAAGANAIYLGLQNFSARAFAGNFSHEEFIEAIQYCHIRDVKIYVTMNTMLYETEIENAKKEVAFLYDNDVDGLLIQDLGLFHYVRTCYPDLAVHCSTQMHIHNVAGVNYMKQQGVERVVMARETPIEIIEEACKCGVQIEVFVYGAICISYSGQCLMSSVSKNRSANRGMCAQCCRLKYDMNGKNDSKHSYLLSPKDLNVIDEIPALIKAGVASLKIEGRMKRPEYVWLVTKTFREAIDAYYEGKSYQVSPQRLQELMLMFNRGFSKGHLFHASIDERMSQFRPNHQGLEIGTVVQYKQGRVQVKLSTPLYQHDGLRIMNTPTDTGLTAVKIYDRNERLVNHANQGDIVWLECHDKPFPKAGQKLHKTSDAHLIKMIDDQIETPTRRIPIYLTYSAKINEPFVLKVIDHDGHQIEVTSRQVIQQAKTSPVLASQIEVSLRKLGDTPYEIETITGEVENIFLPISAINEVRRNAIDQLNTQRKKCHVREGKQEYHFNINAPAEPLSKDLIYNRNRSSKSGYTRGYGQHQICPVINQTYTNVVDYEDNILSSYCDLAGKHTHCIAGMTMNIANSYAMAYVYSHAGIDGIIVSSEMSDEMIVQSKNAFTQRYGFEPYLYQFTQGRRTVMYIKDGFTTKPISTLQDLQHEQYPIIKDKNTVEILESDEQNKTNQNCYGTYRIIG